MTEIEPLRAASIEVTPVDPSSRDAQHCLDQYFDELASRFDGGFDRKLDGTADLREFAQPDGCLLVARLRGEPVGCAAIRTLAAGAGEIKRMWVSPHVRGLGLGRRLLRELEQVAESRGLRTIRLDTNRALGEALQLYRSAGYREIACFNDNPYAHHWFEKILPASTAPQNRAHAR